MPQPINLADIRFDPDPLEWIYVEAENLLKEHGLWEQGWRFEMSKEKTALGRCFYSKKKIVYSEYFVHEPREQVLDTLLHEIAHALVGRGHGHNYVWKHKAREIGANPSRLAHGAISSAKPNWIVYCTSCDYQLKPRHRLRKSLLERYRCGKCGGKFDAEYIGE